MVPESYLLVAESDVDLELSSIPAPSLPLCLSVCPSVRRSVYPSLSLSFFQRTSIATKTVLGPPKETMATTGTRIQIGP